MRVGGTESGPRARALKRQFSKPRGGTICMETIFWGEGILWGVTGGTGKGNVTVELVITVRWYIGRHHSGW